MKSILVFALLALTVFSQNCKKSGEDKGDDSLCSNFTVPSGRSACCDYVKASVLGFESETWTCAIAPT